MTFKEQLQGLVNNMTDEQASGMMNILSIMVGSHSADAIQCEAEEYLVDEDAAAVEDTMGLIKHMFGMEE